MIDEVLHLIVYIILYMCKFIHITIIIIVKYITSNLDQNKNPTAPTAANNPIGVGCCCCHL